MKCIAPDYYKEFSCIAGACKHSCCVGWEIDIDGDSLQRYQALEGPMGVEIRSHISTDGDTPHYILAEQDRCPFLQEDGLCRMILELGEDALCQICADHPRFRNDFAHQTEIGLGLCCEAAGQLILKRQKPVTLEVLWDDGNEVQEDPEELTLLSFRDMLFSILQDRSCTIDERLDELLDTCGGMPERSLSQWASLLLRLERLDEGWTTLLTSLQQADTTDEPLLHSPAWETAFEQAGLYFLYRHLPAALEDGDTGSKAAFAALSVRLLRALCGVQYQKSGAVTLDDLVELARMYSGEVEYSEDNLQQLFDWLTIF